MNILFKIYLVLITMPFLNSAEAQVVKDDKTGYEYVSESNGLKIIGKKTFENKGGGYSVRYEDQNGKLDVFVYDNEIVGIENGTTGKNVTAEFKSVKNVMQAAVKKGAYKSASEDLVLSKSLASVVKGRFLSAAYLIEYPSKDGDAGVTMKSITLFKGLGGRFLKFRYSCSTETNIDIESVVKFAESIEMGLGKKK